MTLLTPVATPPLEASPRPARGTEAAGVGPVPARGGRAPGLLAAGLFAAVVLLDQTSKWWAWRSVFAVINPGGTWFLGRTVSGWYSGSLGGALLDLVSLEVLALAAFVLLRRPRTPLVLAAGILTIGGWASNLVDRLGMHAAAAPGSERGAVDFIPLGHYYYNVADVCITAGTLLLLGVLAARIRHQGWGRRGGWWTQPAVPSRPWRNAWRWAVAAAVAPVFVVGAATLLSPTSGGLPDTGHAPATRVDVSSALLPQGAYAHELP